MAAQCCTSRIFDFEWGHLSLTQSFSVISENIIINHTHSGNHVFGLHFCRRPSNFNRYVIGRRPQATEFGEVTQNNDNHAVQGHSRSPISVPIESPYATSCVTDINLPLSCTVSEMWPIIGPSFAFDKECLVEMPCWVWTTKFWKGTFGRKKLERSPYRTLCSVFRYF